SISTTAALGVSCSRPARRCASDGGTLTIASIASSTSRRPRSRAICIACSTWISVTRTASRSVGATKTAPGMRGRAALPASSRCTSPPARRVRAVARRDERKLLVGLDVGTSKVVAIVGELSPDGKIEVVGFGSSPSRGLKRGVVVNIESTVQSIQRAVEEAELMAGCEINSVYTGIAGSHVRSLNSHGIVAIRDKEVTPGDVERVIDAARAVAIPADQRILHVLPQEFIIDAQEGIREPVGMSGVRLEAKVHLVTGAVSAAQNIVKCVQRCGLGVNDIVLEQLASSYACLTEDERELGVCLVDSGGGTTDIAVFYGG